MDQITTTIQRFLGNNGGYDDDAAGSGEVHFGVHVAYTDILTSMIFLAAIYMSGIFSVKFLRMPSLVGEIFAGILLGPNLANIVPSPETFVLLGEIGLILLVLEAGIDIDLTTLKLIGSRGILIALLGSFLPVVFASFIAYALGFEGMSAIAAGCCFAPTSLGIAMNVLRKAGIVNTPVGQLIVAAAIIDDMVACK
jgi:Kef-type K+ transport system membrane component KefB